MLGVIPPPHDDNDRPLGSAGSSYQHKYNVNIVDFRDDVSRLSILVMM